MQHNQDPLRALQHHIGRQWNQLQQQWNDQIACTLQHLQATAHDAISQHPALQHMQRVLTPPARAQSTLFASVSAPSAAPSSPSSSSSSSSPSTTDPDDAPSSKARAATPEDEAEIQRWIEGMTEEERLQLGAQLWQEMMKETKVKIEGKKMTLWQLWKEKQKEDAEHEYNVKEFENRGIPPWMRYDEVESTDLRQGMVKQQLFEEEEDDLEMARMGIGFIWSKFPNEWLCKRLGRADIQFGIFADPKCVEEQLGEQWAGEDPEEVLRNPEFYQQALKYSPQFQTTVLAIPARDLPVKYATDMLLSEIRQRVNKLYGEMNDEDESTIQDLQRVFSSYTLGPSGLLTKKGDKFKQGGHFFFSTLPNGALAAEATTPGIIRDQALVQLGVFDNPRVTHAVMDMVLGEDAVDPLARLTAGNNMLYAANGFTFNPSEANSPRNFAVPEGDTWPEFEVEEVDASPRLFSYDARLRRRLFRAVRPKGSSKGSRKNSKGSKSSKTLKSHPI